jgi:hypothetical protein
MVLSAKMIVKNIFVRMVLMQFAVEDIFVFASHETYTFVSI